MPAARTAVRLKWIAALLALVFVALAVVLFVGWRTASNLKTGLRPWEIAPADSIFFFHVRDVIAYQEKFGKYHADSLGSPTIVKVRSLRKTVPFLNPQPMLEPPRGMTEIIACNGKVALYDDFAALVTPRNDTKRLFDWVGGGRVINSLLALAMWKESVELEAGGTWETHREDGLEWQTGTSKAAGVLHVACVADWFLVSNDIERLKEACRHVRAEKLPALGDDPVFQKSLTDAHREALIWIYAATPLVREPLRRSGRAEAAEVLDPARCGLKAFAWGWHTGGPNTTGYDLVAFQFEDDVIAHIGTCFPPLPAGSFGLPADGRLAVLCASRDPAAVHAWPAMSALRMNGDLQGIVAGATTFRRMVARTPGADASINWEAPIKPGLRSEGWIDRAGTLTGTEKPFLEVRTNYRGLVEFWKHSLETHYDDWQKVTAPRDIPLPTVPVSLDVNEYFRETRLTMGLESGQLMIYNSIALGKSGSTLLTAMVGLAGTLWPDEIVTQETAWGVEFEGSSALDSRLFLQLAVISGIFMSPIYTSDSGGNVYTDFSALQFLTTAQRPKPTAP